MLSCGRLHNTCLTSILHNDLLQVQCGFCTAFGIVLMFARVQLVYCPHTVITIGLACENTQHAWAYACKVAKTSSRDAYAFQVH